MSTAPLIQSIPVAIMDGSGGMIVVWLDTRNGHYYDIYAQRVDINGNAVWAEDGIVITSIESSFVPEVVSDGAGGAIIAWYTRGGVPYIQRRDAGGNLLWTVNSVPVGKIAADGASGVIVAFENTSPVHGMYAQRIDGSGNLLWPVGGVLLSTGQSDHDPSGIVSDGAQGGIVMWIDTDWETRFMDIYARRVDAFGNALWNPGGVLICDDANAGHYTATYPVITTDGAGGAIVAWDDLRTLSPTIYAQRVNGSGNAVWAANGVSLSSTLGEKPKIVSDDAGGAIVTWSLSDIYAQRVNAAGNPLWTPDGVALCTQASLQREAVIATDGAGGAIVSWEDGRSSGTNLDIYARRVDAAGNALWTPDGVPLCTAATHQMYPRAVSDDDGGAIVAWIDYRNSYDDIFAQRITASGDLPTAVSGPARSPSLVVSDVYPNPFAGSASMDLALATSSSVRVEVFDVAGRSVRVLEFAGETGSRRVEFDGRDQSGHLLPSGVYFCRVEVAGEMQTRKMVIAR